MTHIIDGTALAQQVLGERKSTIEARKKKRPPGLATILVGDDQASKLYVANKRKKAFEIGIQSFHHGLDSATSQTALIQLIDRLNRDDAVDAILVQLPLPAHIDQKTVLEAVLPTKDVDGFHPMNLGYLMQGNPQVVACTPLGIMHLFHAFNYSLIGKHAVVIGRSTIVGKPMAQLLIDAGATVTVCHSHTKDLASFTKQADVLVVAVGRARLITREHVRSGAFVVDVGINRDEHNKICGDVDFDSVKDRASYITPVPGGVGPMTIAMLLHNTVANFLRTS